MDGKIMIIDGNSIMYRAFHGTSGEKLLSTYDGLYTNAVFGFLNILFKYIDEEKPDGICVAFDHKTPTFRHNEYSEYKAHRKGMPEELVVQMPVIKDVLDAMKIKRVEAPGYEADDILGTLSFAAEKKGMNAVIVTGDRDSLQLASKAVRIKIPVTKGGRTETEYYDPDKIYEKYGVLTAQLIDVKGLMGDTSDNIPGVPGIGEKTAISLIKQYSSIEKLYENIDTASIRELIRKNLLEHKEDAILSKRLATIDRNVPGVELTDDFRRQDYDGARLFELFNRLEFKSLIEKLGLKADIQCTQHSVEPACITQIEQLDQLVASIHISGSFAFLFLLEDNGALPVKRLEAAAFSYKPDESVFIRLGDCICEEEFLKKIKPVMEDGNIQKFCHNFKSCMVFLKNKGIELNNGKFDTMIGAYILDSSRETYRLEDIAREMMGVSITAVEQLRGKGKNAVPIEQIDDRALSFAMGSGTDAIYKMWPVIEQKIVNNGQKDLLYDIEMPLIGVLADMEYYGFKVDIEKLKDFSVMLERRIGELVGEIYSLANEEFNINSTKQLGVILFEKLHLPVVKKTKTGYSTDAEVLEQLEPRHEIIPRILEYRQLVKLKSTYVEGLLSVINPYTGRIHSSFNQTVTVTGRISSAEPNLQNIPVKLELGRKIRKVFVPGNEEYILADADYSQIELRVLAHITGDKNMTDAFINNEDIHRRTASQVFGIPFEEVTADMRNRAKAVNFGIVYGIGDFSLAKDIGITRKEARTYIEGYLDRYPNVRKYMRDTVEKGKETGHVETIFNRRRYLPELRSSNFNIKSFGERIAMNTPIQGSAADIIKIAMVNVSRELKGRNMKSRLILQVHDELIVETHRDEVDEVRVILKDGMENAVRLSVPLVAEVKFGQNWYETK